jgi:hypothetical protein
MVARGEDLVIFLAEEVLFHHAAANGVVEVLILLESFESNRAIDFLKIAEA